MAINQTRWRTPTRAAIIVTLSVGALIWSRSFLAMLGLGVYILIAATACISFLARIFNDGSRDHKIAGIYTVFAIVGCTCLTGWLVPQLQDRVTFELWYPTHRALIGSYAGRSGVIAQWDASGWAGAADIIYLVSDPSDTLGAPTMAQRWLSARSEGGGGKCPLENLHRMR